MWALRPLNLFLRSTSSVVFRAILCSCLLDNLKERHVAHFEDCFFVLFFFVFLVAGTVRAVVFSPAFPFVFEGSCVLS